MLLAIEAHQPTEPSCRASSPKPRARPLRLEIGREEADAVGDRGAPADRAVVPRQFPDRRDIGRGLDLVAADRARVERAKEPRLVQLTEQRLRDAAGAAGPHG